MRLLTSLIILFLFFNDSSLLAQTSSMPAYGISSTTTTRTPTPLPVGSTTSTNSSQSSQTSTSSTSKSSGAGMQVDPDNGLNYGVSNGLYTRTETKTKTIENGVEKTVIRVKYAAVGSEDLNKMSYSKNEESGSVVNTSNSSTKTGTTTMPVTGISESYTLTPKAPPSPTTTTTSPISTTPVTSTTSSSRTPSARSYTPLYTSSNTENTYYRPSGTSASYAPTLSDSEYGRRVRTINSRIPLRFNSTIRNFIHVYTVKKRDLSERVLAYQDVYFPIFEKVLLQYGLPRELKYLAVVESALDPTAVSRAGAVGIWQFMPSTGKMYGLKVGSQIDERRDPYKASVAAARFLSDLYNKYGDWYLAIAAYNCGPGNVNKAIRRSGGKRDFWSIKNYLPRETRGYVPAFIACVYWMNYHYDHNLYAFPIPFPHAHMESDTVMVRGALHFDVVAKYLDIPVIQLDYLNPSVKNRVIPSGTRFALRIPERLKWTFRDNQYAIYAAMRSSDMQIKTANSMSKSSRSYGSSSSGKKASYYTVRRGDNLSKIASRYGVRVSDLKRWNGIRGTTIRSGQKLKMYGSKKSGSSSSSSSGGWVSYKVRSGDTLWGITRKYPKNTVSGLRSKNGLSSRATLKAGTYIKVKK